MRWFAALLLAVYLVLVARLTLADPSSGRPFFDLAWSWGLTEVTANVALFVPIGFLLAVVLDRAWAAVMFCVLLSVGIELAQATWLPTRVPSLADVQHNGLGGLLGAMAAWPCLRVLT